MAFQEIEVIDLTSDTEDDEEGSGGESIAEKVGGEVVIDNLPAAEVNVGEDEGASSASSDSIECENIQLQAEQESPLYAVFDLNGDIGRPCLYLFSQVSAQKRGETAPQMMAAANQQSGEAGCEEIDDEEEEAGLPDAGNSELRDNSEGPAFEPEMADAIASTSKNREESISPAKMEVLGQPETHDSLQASSSSDSDQTDKQNEEEKQKNQELVCPRTVEYKGKILPMKNYSIKLTRCDTRLRAPRNSEVTEASHQSATMDESPRPRVPATPRRQIKPAKYGRELNLRSSASCTRSKKPYGPSKSRV